jgi:hypothetical protein
MLELDRIYAVLQNYMESRTNSIEVAGIPAAHFTLAVYRDTSIDKPYIQKDVCCILNSDDVLTPWQPSNHCSNLIYYGLKSKI